MTVEYCKGCGDILPCGRNPFYCAAWQLHKEEQAHRQIERENKEREREERYAAERIRRNLSNQRRVKHRRVYRAYPKRSQQPRYQRAAEPLSSLLEFELHIPRRILTLDDYDAMEWTDEVRH